MRKHLLLPVIFFLIIASCKDNPPTEPDSNVNNNETSQVIGVEGGNLEYENLVVNIPAGSFNSSHELKVSKNESGNSGFSSPLSEVYVIEGIPDDYQLPIKIKIKGAAPKEGEPAIAVGEEIFSKREGAVATRYYFIDSEIDSEFVKGSLPIPDGGFTKNNSVMKTDKETSRIPVLVAGRVSSFTTAQGHFKIDVDGSGISETHLQTLGSYFEEAYNYYLELGFSYDKRTSWPMSVTIKNMGEKLYGEYSNSFLGHNHGFIEFNRSATINAASDPETRRTAGHEFFHFVQSMYDPRNAFSRAKTSYDWYWLDEAAGTWSEQKFTLQTNYTSDNTAINRERPLEGLQKGAGNDARAHGYGMSTFINYLTDNYGDSILVNIYKRILLGKSALDAIFESTNSTSDLVKNFFTGYFDGSLRGSPGFSHWWITAANQHVINSSSDVPKIYNVELSDYGGAYYRVEVKKPDAREGESLKAESSVPGTYVAAIKNVGGTTQFLGVQELAVTIPNLKELKDQNARIIFLLIDLSPSSGYKGSKPVNLQIDIENSQFNQCYISIAFSIYARESSKTDPNDVKEGYATVGYGGALPGVFSNNTFTSLRDSVYSNGFTIHDSVSITLNESLTKILNMKLVSNSGFPEGYDNFYWQESLFEIENIDGGPTEFQTHEFNLDGVSVCDHLKTVEYRRETQDKLITRISNYCNEFSTISVELEKR